MHLSFYCSVCSSSVNSTFRYNSGIWFKDVRKQLLKCPQSNCCRLRGLLPNQLAVAFFSRPVQINSTVNIFPPLWVLMTDFSSSLLSTVTLLESFTAVHVQVNSTPMFSIRVPVASWFVSSNFIVHWDCNPDAWPNPDGGHTFKLAPSLLPALLSSPPEVGTCLWHALPFPRCASANRELERDECEEWLLRLWPVANYT